MDPNLPPDVEARLGQLAKTIAEATAEREALIVSAYQAHDVSMRELARASGLTHTGVRKMLARRGADVWKPPST